MKKIAIFGAGGFGREVEMLVRNINCQVPKFEFIGYFDDGIARGVSIGDSVVLGDLSDLNNYDEKISLVLAIGDPKLKKHIVASIKNQKVEFATLIHPNVEMGERVIVGAGSIICAGNIITEDINIGDHVILNLACTVGHDARIGSFCSFMPTVNISGEVTIEDGVFMGTGSKIINQKKIGAGALIGAGAVIVKDIPASCTAVGNPAKPIKFHN